MDALFSIELQLEAIKKLSPLYLSKHVKRDGDLFIVDIKAVTSSSQRESELMFTILGSVYGWDYQTPFENTTIYFKQRGENEIIGGAYDSAKRERLTSISLCSAVGPNISSLYTYTGDDFAKLKNNLRTAS